MAIPSQHRDWFIEVCKLAGIAEEDVPTVVEESSFVLQNMQPVSFTQGITSDHTEILVQGLIAPLPETPQEKEKVLTRALAYQWKAAGPQAATIGIAPGSTDLILSATFIPSETSPESMIQLLKLFGMTCAFLREGLFSDEETNVGNPDEAAPDWHAAQHLQQTLITKLAP